MSRIGSLPPSSSSWGTGEDDYFKMLKNGSLDACKKAYESLENLKSHLSDKDYQSIKSGLDTVWSHIEQANTAKEVQACTKDLDFSWIKIYSLIQCYNGIGTLKDLMTQGKIKEEDASNLKKQCNDLINNILNTNDYNQMNKYALQAEKLEIMIHSQH